MSTLPATLVFFDTEFTQLDYSAQLISLGLVSEDGTRSFYRELKGWKDWDASDFVHEHVIPFLGPVEDRVSKLELAVELAEWFAGFGGPVQIASDAWPWDGPLLMDVFSQKNGPGWPDCLLRAPKFLNEGYLENYTVFEAEVERLFASGRYREHHAGDDAEVNRLAYLAAAGEVR